MDQWKHPIFYVAMVASPCPNPSSRLADFCGQKGTQKKIRDHSYCLFVDVDLNDFCLGRGSGTYQHPWECSEYVICNGAGPIVQICPSGLLFDSVNSICDFPYKVTCGVTGSPSDPNPDPVNILTRAPEVYVPTTILTHVPSASKPRMLDTVHSEVPDPAQAQIVFSGVSDSDAG